MPASKRQKLSEDVHIREHNDVQSDQGTNDSASDDFSADDADDGSADEIEGLQKQKSRQTSKRKIRATGTSTFGATLQSLLKTDVPSALPLSLKPSLARKRNDEKLELKAKKVLQIEKKEKEDKGRITDIIGGWGGESERALRKVAQRGVVKLFNVIQQSQTNASVNAEERKASRGTGKPTLPAPLIDGKTRGKGKGKSKDNIIGRGKESAVDKDEFFDMIKSGGTVSKT